MKQSTNAPKIFGLFACVSLVVGNMVGSGIFLLPSSLASFGSISLLAWVVTAIGAMFLALVFAKMSQLFPVVGGPYAYCREGFGDFVAFQMAFCYWVAIVVGNAATVVAAVSYLAIFYPILKVHNGLSLSVALMMIWAVTLLNIFSIRETKFIQIITTILKLLPLIAIAVVGAFYFEPSNLEPFNATGESNISALTAAALLTLWAFVGLESSTVPAEYIVNAKRTIAIATILGTLIAAVFYIVSTAVVMGVVPQAELANSTAPFAEAGRVIFGGWSMKVIAACAILSCLSAVIGWVLLQGQIPLAAAKDGLFPKVFAKLNRQNIPYMGQIISSLIITVLLYMSYSATLVEQFTLLIKLSTLAFLIPYVYTSIAALIIYSRDRHKLPGQNIAVLTFIGIIAFLYSMFTIVGSGQDIVFYGALLLFGCGPIYALLKKEKPGL